MADNNGLRKLIELALQKQLLYIATSDPQFEEAETSCV